MSEVARPRPLLRTTLGGVLRRARLEQGRTLADVARAARVSMPYLSEVERGRKEASSEVLAAVCEALRIELADVLTEVGRDLARERGKVLRFDRRERLDRQERQERHDRRERLDRLDRPDRLERPDLRERLDRPRSQHHISPPVRRSGETLLLAA